MKRAVSFFLAFILIMTLTACQPNPAEVIESTDPSLGNQSKPAPPDPSIPDILTPLSAKELVDSITYVNNGDEYVPVSFIEGGEQQLVGYGVEDRWLEWKDEINKVIKGAPQADTLAKVDTTAMYSDSKPEYEGIPALIFTRIASSGKWELFPIKVRYEKYDLANQPSRREWIDYFGSKLEPVSADTPIVITEAFFFAWNLDGKEVALVNSSNRIWHYGEKAEGVSPNPPQFTNTVSYDMSALFIDGNEPFSLADSIYDQISNKPLSSEDGIYESYLPPAEASGSDGYENNYSFIQLDPNGSLIKCPVFTCGEIGYINKMMMLLCDIDGDGRPELLTMRASIYAPITVYKLIEGSPLEVFRINTGA